MMNNRLVLVCLQWRRYRQIRSSITVQNVDQFCLFDGRYHDAPSFWIRREVLTRNNTPRSRFSKSLFVYLDETGRFDVII